MGGPGGWRGKGLMRRPPCLAEPSWSPAGESGKCSAPRRRRNAGDPGKRRSTRTRSGVLEQEQMLDWLQTLCIPKRSVPSFTQELPSVPPKLREARFNLLESQGSPNDDDASGRGCGKGKPLKWAWSRVHDQNLWVPFVMSPNADPQIHVQASQNH